MAYCRECGAFMQDGAKFCAACGAPVENAPVRAIAPPVEYPAERPRKKRRSIFGRLWFWLLVLAVAAGIYWRGGLDSVVKLTQRPAATSAVSTSRPTAKPGEAPAAAEVPAKAAAPAETAAPESPAIAENEIRPEVKEFLDAYEACMDEYVEFMKKYMNADPNSMVAMMGDYYSILARYTEFAEKIDDYDEDELTNAELMYYIEVTSRVSQKLLSVAG